MAARLLLAVSVVAVVAAGCRHEDAEPELAPEEVVARASERMAAVESFRFVYRAEKLPANAPGLTLTYAEGDLAVPDRLRADVAGTLTGVPLKSEIVVVGTQSFLKDPTTQRWREFETEASPLAFFDPAGGALTVIERVQALEHAGFEEVGGEASYRLEGEIAASDLRPLLGTPPSDERVSVELWVGTDDFLLRRVRVEGSLAEGEPENVVRSIELSEFGREVAIEPPPVSG